MKLIGTLKESLSILKDSFFNEKSNVIRVKPHEHWKGYYVLHVKDFFTDPKTGEIELSDMSYSIKRMREDDLVYQDEVGHYIFKEQKKTQFKVAVSGSRFFRDYNYFQEKMDYYLKQVADEIVIMSCASVGIDQLASRYANEKGYAFKSFPLFEKKDGRKARDKRNMRLISDANALVVFSSDTTTNSESLMSLAKANNKPIRIAS